jgi:hypothetical protein
MGCATFRLAQRELNVGFVRDEATAASSILSISTTNHILTINA